MCLLNIKDLENIHVSFLVWQSKLTENKEVVCHGLSLNLGSCGTAWEHTRS